MFILPELPYGYDSLAPTLGETTLRTHHDKHHAKYVSVANELLAKSGAAPESLEALVLQASAEGDKKMFNNAGQAWNHGFFWESMTPSYAAPTGALLAAIEAGHGDVDSLKAKFVAEGVGHFGSGWVWLLAKGGELSVASTHDGITSLEVDATPLLVCDLWEHAYYLDYKNDRRGFPESLVGQAGQLRLRRKAIGRRHLDLPGPHGRLIARAIREPHRSRVARR